MVSTYDSMMETPTMPVSPTTYAESQLDQDEVYPCKGCGEILEEGKAFELAGNRWHIDCFRCNTCATLLDSDANLLLLGDGSLICNNCTYSCNACGNKIEDLAILTGDQAFCASCFRCRNCKKKIENLRYARTTQGIFCMACHESVIQKRRKNRNKLKQQEANGRDKKLPELPPPKPDMLHSAFAPEADASPEKHTEADHHLDHHYGSNRSRREQTGSSSQERSPTRSQQTNDHSSILPASTYSKSQPQRGSQPVLGASVYDPANELDGFFVPLVLDPTPATTASPLHSPHPSSQEGTDTPHPLQTKSKDSSSGTRDYLGLGLTDNHRPSREYLKEGVSQSSRSSSSERKVAISPHIAFQEKNRTSDHIADHIRKPRHPAPMARAGAGAAESTSPSTYPGTQNEFKLQEAPKSRREPRDSNDNSRSPTIQSPAVQSQSATPQIDNTLTASPVEAVPKNPVYTPPDVFLDRSPSVPQQPSRIPPPPMRMRPIPQVERPARGDSLAASVTRKEAPGSGSATPHISEMSHGRQMSSSSQMNGGMSISKPLESTNNARGVYEPTNGRSSSQADNNTGPAFAAPRQAPPHPPSNHKTSESTSTGQSDVNESPLHVPNYFGLDGSSTDSRRDENTDGALRKLSNVMRGHARSVSDRVIASPKSQRWAKSPMNGSVDLGSPTSSMGLGQDSREESIILRSQLRRAQQRIADLEAEKNSLQSVVNGSPEMKHVNSALKEKRSTIAILDTQREVVVRELEIMTEHLKKVKDSNRPLDMTTFQSEVLDDFAGSLGKLKSNLTSEIEGLVQKRNDLTDEISSLIQMKDKGFQEYENVSNRNAQLTQHNHELVQSIQEMMKSSKQPNGLGLYLTGSGQSKDRMDSSSNDLRQAMDSSSTFVLPDNEDPAIINTPQIIKMQKNKPNMLRKGGFGKTLRGIKGALVPERVERTPTMQGESIGMPYNFAHHTDANPGAPRPIPIEQAQPKNDQSRNFRGFFGGSSDKNGARHLKTMQNGSNPNLVPDYVSPSQLFGSELSARCEFEKRNIPAIVSRCVEEVELRGMDAEGIYRKSGGSGQVNTVKAGFEQTAEHDISDPELEIHAVTSCLKQYFRRLPVPLITFDVYDFLLDASRVEDTDSRALKMREAIDRLPKAHRDCLEFLIFHLARVTSHEKDNLMTPLNLAVVFAPTIMRPASIEREMLDMQVQRQAVQSLLELNKIIFQSES